MKRFQSGKNSYGKAKFGFFKNACISVALFLAILCSFLFMIGKTSSQTLDEQKKILQDAIEKSVVQCYVTEGRYPENFAYIEEKYNIIYDKDRFRVDYRVFGTNMMPDIEIIELED